MGRLPGARGSRPVGRTPWEDDTLVLVFSTTKGISAMTMAVARSRGLLDYDEKVATYWPEFGPEGKEKIRSRSNNFSRTRRDCA